MTTISIRKRENNLLVTIQGHGHLCGTTGWDLSDRAGDTGDEFWSSVRGYGALDLVKPDSGGVSECVFEWD